MSLFSKIIAGELPGEFVGRDEKVVAFLSIAPLRPGHTLVVPRQEIDKWTDADPALFTHCVLVAQNIGAAVRKAWGAPRSGLVIAGFDIPHLHLHVFPSWGIGDFDLARAIPVADPSELVEPAQRIRTALHELGHGEFVSS